MRYQIRLEKWTTTKNASGDNQEGQIKYNLWADIQDLSQSKVAFAGQSELMGKMRFRLYFKPNLKVSGNWKVIYNGSRYTIQSISPVNGERFYWDIIGQKIDKN